MRHLISGVVAAVAVFAAAPAMACGYSSCSPCGYSYSPCGNYGYVAPVAAYSYSYGYGSGCGTGCGGWATQRLAMPEQQYYYVNQGPVYSGPGNWAPMPTYAEPSVRGWSGYARPYGYGYGYRHRVWGPRAYGYRAYRPYAGGYRYGYAHRHYGMHRAMPYGYSRPLRRFY
jgi:hypothetical protein